ncbi:MAG: HAD family hydrolase [Clostridia bacterium]|nr:HAD family hydrolase [Clostridia bacterium]
MKKFEGMLFCTDLDGTLYSDDKTVSRENLDAIEYFKENGGLFTFITGRVPQTAGEMVKLIRPNAPYGCVNGGGIYDHVNNKYIWNMTLQGEFIDIIREIDKRLPEIGIQFNTEKAVYFNKYNNVMVRFREITGLPDIACHFEEVNEPVLKVVFSYDDEKYLYKLKELIADHPYGSMFDYTRADKELYEILPKNASKGNLLLKMAEILNIEKTRTVAVGDYNNDVSLLNSAHYSFAVRNAVPEALAAAKKITVSNNENAIAVIISELDKEI